MTDDALEALREIRDEMHPDQDFAYMLTLDRAIAAWEKERVSKDDVIRCYEMDVERLEAHLLALRAEVERVEGEIVRFRDHPRQALMDPTVFLGRMADALRRARLGEPR